MIEVTPLVLVPPEPTHPDAPRTGTAALSGALDTGLIAALGPLIDAVEDHDVRRLILDLSGVTALRSGALPPFIRLGEGLAARGGGLGLCAARSAVARVLDVLQGHFFVVATDVDQAISRIALRAAPTVQPALPFAEQPAGDVFRVTIRTGAVAPSGRRQTLAFDQTGLLTWTGEHPDRPTEQRPFYARSEFVNWLSAWTKALIETHAAPATRAPPRVDGDWLEVAAEQQGRRFERRVVNAYDSVLCSFVATICEALPDRYHVGYSELWAARLR